MATQAKLTTSRDKTLLERLHFEMSRQNEKMRRSLKYTVMDRRYLSHVIYRIAKLKLLVKQVVNLTHPELMVEQLSALVRSRALWPAQYQLWQLDDSCKNPGQMDPRETPRRDCSHL